MTRDEAKKVLIVLEDNYPATYTGMSREQKQRQIENYFDFFKEYDIAVVVMALRNYIKANKYPPTIAGLQEQINLILPGESNAELWNAIKKACQNSAYNALSEFEKLPGVCQKWIGGPSGLKDLSMVEPAVFDTVVRGEFLKSIPELKARTEVQRGLPAEVRRAIQESMVKMIGGSEQ